MRGAWSGFWGCSGLDPCAGAVESQGKESERARKESETAQKENRSSALCRVDPGQLRLTE